MLMRVVYYTAQWWYARWSRARCAADQRWSSHRVSSRASSWSGLGNNPRLSSAPQPMSPRPGVTRVIRRIRA
jgi:hypothetical protein